MNISRQHSEQVETPERGPRARMRRLMLDTATELMQNGSTPSVSEVAEAAEVSRATAYRYFPSQAALVDAVVDEALGPILRWRPPSGDTQHRISDLFESALPRIDDFEATFRAALKLSLEQWAQGKAGTQTSEPQFTRGHRIDLLENAIEPLRGALPEPDFERLAQALSLTFGVEVLIVLKDIWGLNVRQAQSVAQWAASALVRAAISQPSNPESGPEALSASG